MTENKLKKSSRCWVVLIGCCIMCGIGFGIPMTTMSAFMKPMIVSMGSSATGITLYFTILALASIPCVIVGPRFLKKNAAATVAACGAVTGIALLLISLMPSVPMVWAAAILVGLTYPMCSTLAAPILISNWFHKGAGTFMGVAMAFTGVGSAFLVPIVTGFIADMGWQGAMQGMAIAYLIIMVVVGLACARFEPMAMGVLPFGAAAEKLQTFGDEKTGISKLPGMEYKAIFRTIPFWVMAICLLLVGFTGSVNTQINTIAQLSGFTAVVAGFVVTGMSLGNVIGKLVLGALKDKFSGTVASLFGVICAVAGVVMFLVGIGGAGDMVMIAGGFICGLGSCLGTMAGPLFVLDTFGPREYGTILGTMSVFTTIGLALGAPIASSFYDIGGSYIGALVAYIVCFIVIVPCVFVAVKAGQRIWKAAGEAK